MNNSGCYAVAKITLEVFAQKFSSVLQDKVICFEDKDGLNDYIDYSALANKQNLVFNIYDRYGAKIHQGDKTNQYRWDGTIGGRKAPTGSYWYSVTWTENNKNKNPVKFSGWIIVKNRE